MSGADYAWPWLLGLLAGIVVWALIVIAASLPWDLWRAAGCGWC